MNNDLSKDLASAVRSVTNEWKKAKLHEERVSRQKLERLRRWHPPKVTLRDAAFQVMEQAYNKASSFGRYYANARQIMYAARPLVLEQTGGEIWKDSSYFTQTLLKDYLEYYEPGWKVVWDSRGHLTEPHTGISIGIGGVEVRRYIQAWTTTDLEAYEKQVSRADIDTTGPALRYSAVLFIEKEGFDEILRDAGLAERFDISIMSTKGLPVGAACQLAVRFNQEGVRVLVMHDFDLAGFKIVRTLRQGTRLAPGAEVEDIGFRLDDVEGLQSELVNYKQKKDPREYLRVCGATREEQEFLVSDHSWESWEGERVELNAMTSEKLITWLEKKLEKLKIAKVTPDSDVLDEAYRRAWFLQEVDKAAEKIAEQIKDSEVEVPDDLAERVKEKLEESDRDSWDQVVWEIATEEAGPEDDNLPF